MYDDGWVEEGSPIAERKMAALMHEVLSLTIEKKKKRRRRKRKNIRS